MEAQYSNRYEATVRVPIHDVETGKDQILVSNKIHPFFVQVPDGQSTPPSSEGHSYHGTIKNGAWVDASNLKPGYRLLNDDGSWATVSGITVEQAPLQAYNLTVNGYHTYFVAGNAEANPVWVHNQCGVTFTPAQLQSKYKHAGDFGVNGNYNLANAKLFEQAIADHVKDPQTIKKGIYRGDANSTVHFNPITNNVVVTDGAGKFVTGFKLQPGTPQYNKYINDGFLR